MDIATKTESWGTRRGYWITSRHGQGSQESIIVDTTGMNEAVHYPNGHLIDGTPLGEVTATPGVYRIWDVGASDGTEDIAGFLYDCPTVKVGGVVKTQVGASLFVHGFVDPAQCIFGVAADNGFDEPVTAAALPKLIAARTGKTA